MSKSSYPAAILKSIDKIDMVYDRVKDSRGGEDPICFNDAGKAPSNGTIETYRNAMKAFMNYAYEKWGITDIGKLREKHGAAYVSEKIAAGASVFTIKNIPHALSSFGKASAETGVFKRECRVIKKADVLGKIKENGLIRKSEYSTRMLATDADYKKVDAQFEKSRSPNAQTVRDMHAVQRYLGFRAHEVVKMQVSDLKIKVSELEARVQGKGGLEGFQKTDYKPVIDMLKSYSDGKKPGSFVFTLQGKDGNPKPHKEVEKLLKREVRKAARKAGVDRGGKKYTSHSARRAYAQEKMNGYARKSLSDLRSLRDDRFKTEKNGKWLEKKYKSALDSIRKKIKDPVKRVTREMTHKELCTWLTSIDLRHGRLDIVRYYAVYPTSGK